MAIKVIMPKLGLTMKEGTIVNWLKLEGDVVQKGDPIFEVETEKITNEVEAKQDGYLRKILIPAGDTVSCQTVVAIIGNADEDISSLM